MIYVKVTNRCNMNCRHCYNSVCDKSVDMSDEHLQKVVDFVEMRWAAGMSKEPIDIALHGGEPTLYDLEKLQEFCGKMIALGATVSATTNLTYEVTTEHLKLFNMFVREDGSKLIVTSWDAGNVRFTDKQRALWESNVKSLIGMGYDVQPTITLTRPALELDPEYILGKMKEVGVKKVNFERLTHTGRAEENKDLWVTNREVDEWLGRAYIVNAELYNFEVPLFKELELAHVGIKTGCKERLCMMKVVTINPDGTIACCPNDPLTYVGHIDRFRYDQKTEEEKHTHKKLIMKECRRSTECLTCEYFKECNGECCQLSWDESGCPGMIEVIKEIRRTAK